MNVSVNGGSQEMQVNQFKPVIKEKKPCEHIWFFASCILYPLSNSLPQNSGIRVLTSTPYLIPRYSKSTIGATSGTDRYIRRMSLIRKIR